MSSGSVTVPEAAAHEARIRTDADHYIVVFAVSCDTETYPLTPALRRLHVEGHVWACVRREKGSVTFKAVLVRLDLQWILIFFL